VERVRKIRVDFNFVSWYNICERKAFMKRVEVYYNLHKHVFSIRSMSGDDRGRVIAHAKEVHLSDVGFVVQPAGRKRVLNEKRKNVHAFVRGFLLEDGSDKQVDSMTEVTYNPYLFDSFVAKKTGNPVKKANYAYLCKKSVFADGVE
jgi:hypothetical protein